MVNILDTVRDFIRSEKSTYMILQLRRCEETAYERFESLRNLERQGKRPDIAHYDAVFVGTDDVTSDSTERLEELYRVFNTRHPEGFTGHSLSVSDIVALKTDGRVSFHYVDSIGFKELEGFYGGR